MDDIVTIESIKHLFESFAQLERAISNARSALLRHSSPPKEILQRLNLYEEILEKQRFLAKELSQHLRTQNWSDVHRDVKLINGLSGMIRDDAEGILAQIHQESTPVKKEQFLC